MTDFAHDAADSYDAICAGMRLKMLLLGERWAEEADTFDLLLAAGLMRGRA